MSDQRFTGTDRYVATEDLMTAVNAAVTLGRPILIKGEPGTGKTQLAEEIARGLDRPLLQWHIKSTTKAQQGLYEYDAVARLRDSQLGGEQVHNIANYIKRGKLWDAFAAPFSPQPPASSNGEDSTSSRPSSQCAADNSCSAPPQRQLAAAVSISQSALAPPWSLLNAAASTRSRPSCQLSGASSCPSPHSS